MEIYFCPNCGKELESLAFSKLLSKFDETRQIYSLAIDHHLKSTVTFSWVYVFFDIACECNYITKAVFYNRFSEDIPQKEDFYLIHIKDCDFNHISGQYSRENCRKMLEKLVARWNNHSLRTILATPFIGGFKKEQKEKDWVWLENHYQPLKTLIITRKKSANYLTKSLSKEKELNYEYLANREVFGRVLLLHSDIIIHNKFHSKFYAGIYRTHVEVAETSFNIFEPGSDFLENFSLKIYSLTNFIDKFLKPMKLDDKLNYVPESEIEMSSEVTLLIIKEINGTLDHNIDYCNKDKWEFLPKYL